MFSLLPLLFALPLAQAEQEPKVERVWQAEEYSAPDLIQYFADDEEAGKRLDAWWDGNANQSVLTREESVALIRNGILRTTKHRTSVLRWLGNQYVWGSDSQAPDVIELMYHACDFRPEVQHYGMRHYAVYFGLSVVKEKSPNILRALVELCMEVDDPNDLGRVAWGASSQREELLEYLDPYLQSTEDAVREKAEDLRRIFTDEIGAFAWSKNRAKERAQKLFAQELPEIRTTLLTGDSAARRECLDHIMKDGLVLIMDDDFLTAFAACAEDTDATVRRDVVRTVGQQWVWSAQEQNDDAIALMLQMSHDEEKQVRYDSVYYGLSTVRAIREDVIRRMLDIYLFDPIMDAQSRIQWGLSGKEEMVVKLLDQDLASKDPERVRKAYRAYPRLTGKPSPVVPEGMPVVAELAGTWNVEIQLPGGGRSMQLPLVLLVDEEGGVRGTIFDEELEDVLTHANDHGIYLVAKVNGKGGSMDLSAVMTNGEIRGTLSAPSEGVMMPFYGERP